jgi:RNA polymerase sigma factor (sigma-70 family)
LVAVPSIGRALRPAAPEADATRRLYELHARQVYAVCLHRLRDREEAEDATQSTFLNAFRALQRGVQPEFEAAWLCKIAENVCLTRQRSSTRRRRVEAPTDVEILDAVAVQPEVETDELLGLPAALADMPEQQRRALLLREWQGLSYREIADELGLSQAAVETLLFRARRSLANGLERRGEAGSMAAVAKSLLIAGGTKAVIAVATVAATSAVAASPAARHAVELGVHDSRLGAPAATRVAPNHKSSHVRRSITVPAVHVHAAPRPAVKPAPVVVHHVAKPQRVAVARPRRTAAPRADHAVHPTAPVAPVAPAPTPAAPAPRIEDPAPAQPVAPDPTPAAVTPAPAVPPAETKKDDVRRPATAGTDVHGNGNGHSDNGHSDKSSGRDKGNGRDKHSGGGPVVVPVSNDPVPAAEPPATSQVTPVPATTSAPAPPAPASGPTGHRGDPAHDRDHGKKR